MITVTGSSGYLGRSFKKFSTNSSNSIFLSSSTNNDYIYFDHLNLESSKKYFQSVNTVLHLAGPDNQYCETNYDQAKYYSTEFLNKFLFFLKENGVKKFIFISTAKVYKNYGNYIDNANSYIDENSEINPKKKYEYLKVLSEEILSKHNTNNFHVIILRLSNSYGLIDNFRNNDILIHNICFQIKNNSKFSLQSKLNFYRDFIYIEDVIKAIDICCNYVDCYSIFNLGSGKNIFISDIINHLSLTYNLKLPRNFSNNDEFPYLYDISKLRKYKFNPKTNIFNNLKDLITKI